MRIVILPAQKYFFGAHRLPWLARASTLLFNQIYQHAPWLWDPIYEGTLKSAAGKTSAGDIPNPLFSSRRVLADLERLKPDVIYSTFHIMTSKLIGLRDRGLLNPQIPIAWLDTDFTQDHFYYLHSKAIERTFLAHPALEAERVAAGVPPEKLVTTGLFINRAVFDPVSEEERKEFLRQAMSRPDQAPVDPAAAPATIWINGRFQTVAEPTRGLDPDVMTVTISSGRAGVGDYPVIVEGLIREARSRGIKIQIVAVCGDNARNFDAVTRLYDRLARDGGADHATLVASRFVDNAKLMGLVRASHLFIGKSGSLSPFEAAIMGVPRVLIDVIGGQERWVANFFRRLGLAEVVPANEQDSLAQKAFAYIEDDRRMAERRAADQVVRDSYDLSPIAEFYAEAMRSRTAKPSVRLESTSSVSRRCDGLLGRAASFLRRTR